MNDHVRGVLFAHPKQPAVLSGRRANPPVMGVKTQFGGEYPRLPEDRATSSMEHAITKPIGSYAVSQPIFQKRFSDPGRRYSYNSQRSSGYLVSRSRRTSLTQTGFIPTAELPINDTQNAPAKPLEHDIVYYGYPESNLMVNQPPSNAQFAKASKRQFPENDLKEAPLLESNLKDPRYVIEDDVIKEEDSVTSSKIFKLRQLLRVQQKLMLALFGMMVLVIIALILVVVVLTLS